MPPKGLPKERKETDMKPVRHKVKEGTDLHEMHKTSSMLDLVHKSKGYMAPREVVKKIEILAPEAVNTLEKLMLTSKSDSVRLRAAVEVLELAGVTKQTHLTIKTDTKDMTEKEIDQRLQSLMGAAAGLVLEGEVVDVTPKEEEVNE